MMTMVVLMKMMRPVPAKKSGIEWKCKTALCVIPSFDIASDSSDRFLVVQKYDKLTLAFLMRIWQSV